MSPQLDHELWDDENINGSGADVLHTFYARTPTYVPEGVRAYLTAVMEQMESEGISTQSAQQVAEYVRHVDVAELSAAVHEYVLSPFPSGGELVPVSANAFFDGSVRRSRHQA